MGSKESTEAYLRGPGKNLFLGVFQRACAITFARKLRVYLDVSQAVIHPNSRSLDDQPSRIALLSNSKEFMGLIIGMTGEHAKAINDHLVAEGLNCQSKGQLLKLLDRICPALVGSTFYKTKLGQSPFPAIWKELSDILAQELFLQKDKDTRTLEEWQIHNLSLLSAYFQTCSLSSIHLTIVDLNGKSDGVLSIRGTLLRLAERVDPNGNADVLPRIARLTGCPKFGNTSSSLLMASVERLAKDIPNSKGPSHIAFYNNQLPRIPPGLSYRPTAGQIRANRKAVLQHHDYTLLGHIVLAAIEQSLRSWASNKGLVKNAGKSFESATTYIPKLGCSAALLLDLNEIYEAKNYNIRNRAYHGGLLEVENCRMEDLLRIMGKGSVGAQQNCYSPRNIAELCMECLNLLDKECPGGFKSEDTEWTKFFLPTRAELQAVGQSNTDLLQVESAEYWRKLMSCYVSAVCPSASYYFRFFYIGWLEIAFNKINNLAKLYAMSHAFEIIFRSTLHLMRATVLQIGPEGPDGMKINYQVLEETEKGLCSRSNIDRLVQTMPADQHDAIKYYLRVAVKIRNAMAHGAILDFDEEMRDNMGHCLTKATQFLTHAGRTHMTSERAYYRWLWRNSNEDRTLEDWLVAQKDVDAVFHQFEINP